MSRIKPGDWLTRLGFFLFLIQFPLYFISPEWGFFVLFASGFPRLLAFILETSGQYQWVYIAVVVIWGSGLLLVLMYLLI